MSKTLEDLMKSLRPEVKDISKLPPEELEELKNAALGLQATAERRKRD